jgi:hypothetical protein
MDRIKSIADLEAIYGTPAATAMRKVAHHLTPEYGEWISRSRFCTLSTVGPDGTDCSPRGDDGPVVRQSDDKTLLLPDWNGNNRIDSLRNIIADGRVSLMFMIAGSQNVVRVNGRAHLTTDPDILGQFDRRGHQPRSVIIVAIAEVYFQCSRAVLRSRLWMDGDQSAGLPTPGQIIASLTEGEEGGEAYDAAWPERARSSMW